MKILQVLLSPRIGGAETLVAQLEAQWTGSGHCSSTVYLDRPGEPGRGTTRLRRLRREIRRVSPDVILSHSAMPNVFARIAAPRRIPVVTVLHSASDDWVDPKLRWAEVFLRSRTGRVVAVAHEQAEAYCARFGRRGRSSVGVTIIPNGVGEHVIPRMRSGKAPLKAGVAARVAKQKRPDVWVEAAVRAIESGIAETMDWWGPIASECEDLVASVPADSSVRFRGPTSNVPQECLDKLDVYFHTADREALSIGLLEAAIAAVPIVCSDSVAATLPDGVVHERFAAGDADAAFDALSRVAVGYSDYAARAFEASARLKRDFAMDACAHSYLELFRRMGVS